MHTKSARFALMASLSILAVIGCQRQCYRPPTHVVPGGPPATNAYRPAPGAYTAPQAALNPPIGAGPQAEGARIDFRSNAAPQTSEPPAWQSPKDQGTRLLQPEFKDPSSTQDSHKKKEAAPDSDNSRSAEKRPASGLGSLPAGIPRFSAADSRISCGLKPSSEGLEWLKTNGFRTVLHVRKPDAGDAADRASVESAGFKYVICEVDPGALDAKVVEEFRRLVEDESIQPLFAYDDDGKLLGGMWYLYYRTAKNLDDQEAKTRAARLGLASEQQSDHADMWQAIRKYLSLRS